MKKIYQFRCGVCSIDWNLGLQDRRDFTIRQLLESIHCPACCTRYRVEDMTKIDLDSWEYLAAEALAEGKKVTAVNIVRDKCGVSFEKSRQMVERLPAYRDYTETYSTKSLPTVKPYESRMSAVIIDDPVS